MLETYRISRFGFTSNGILSDGDMEELMRAGCQSIESAAARPGLKGIYSISLFKREVDKTREFNKSWRSSRPV